MKCHLALQKPSPTSSRERIHPLVVANVLKPYTETFTHMATHGHNNILYASIILLMKPPPLGLFKSINYRRFSMQQILTNIGTQKHF